MQPWKIKTSLASGLVVFALTGLTPVLSEKGTASECNNFAPGFSEEQLLVGEGNYYDLNGKLVHSEMTSEEANAFGGQLTGRWTGTVISETCKGHFRNPKLVKKNYTLRAEGQFLYNGDFRLEAEWESPRVYKIQKLFLSKKRTHSIEKIDASTWVFTEKYRARGANLQLNDELPPGPLVTPSEALSRTGHTSRIVHEVKTIRVKGNKGTVDHEVYVNGFFVSRDSWSLTRG